MIRLKRSAAAAVALAAMAALLASGSAAGHGSTHPSLIAIRGYSSADSVFYAFGDVTSSKKCTSGRKVKVYTAEAPDGPFTQVDTDTSSANGTWAGSGPLDLTTTYIKAKVVESKYGPKHNRQTCGADSDIIGLMN